MGNDRYTVLHVHCACTHHPLFSQLRRRKAGRPPPGRLAAPPPRTWRSSRAAAEVAATTAAAAAEASRPSPPPPPRPPPARRPRGSPAAASCSRRRMRTPSADWTPCWSGHGERCLSRSNGRPLFSPSGKGGASIERAVWYVRCPLSLSFLPPPPSPWAAWVVSSLSLSLSAGATWAFW